MASRGGQAGNNNAGKNKPWTDAIRRAILADDSRALREIADALVREAKLGNVKAMQELGDRVEGKVPQAITGSDGGPLKIIHEVK